MATFNSFEEIEAWKKARTLSGLIYEQISKPVYDRDKKLRYQMSGSSGSVMDNIAEGQGRGGNNEFKQFLWISKGSVAELRSQLYRSLDQKFISQEVFNDLFEKAIEIEKMIMGLISYLEKSEFQGTKYKNKN